MRTTMNASRAFAFGAALALSLAAAAAGRADDVPSAGADRIFAAGVETGYRWTDVDDNRAFLLPYDPLASGPVFGFDLLYLTPAAGTIALEGGFVDADGWHAAAEYNHGASVDVRASTTRFSHAREHRAPVETVNAPAPGYDPIEVEGGDADPAAEYRDVRQDTRASLRLHAPSYPAHLRASGRILTHTGDRQLRTFFRTCSTHVCHVQDRARPLDEETREYGLGLDGHLGRVDVAFGHTALTYRDEAPDPVDDIGDITNGLPAGRYPHDVNPDLRTRADEVTVSTLVSDRVVLSAAYADALQENESGGLARRTRTAGANLSWRASPALLFVARYDWDREASEDLSASARELRRRNNAAHVTGGLTHQHALEPWDARRLADLQARWAAGGAWELGGRVGWRAREQYAVLRKVAGAWVDEAEKTTATFAAVDARVRPAAGLALDGSAGLEKTDDPVLAIETTTIARYGLGATWTPLPALTLRAAWQGYRGSNDDPAALTGGYHRITAPIAGYERGVAGDAFTLLAAWTPSERLALSASWGLTDAGIEQDLLLGGPGNAGSAFPSPDTDWSGRTRIADLRASWTATRRLAFTAEGLWIDGRESYDPTFAQGAGLEEAGEVDFTKLMGTLQAKLRLPSGVGLTLGGFWARYDDGAGAQEGDGTVRGLLAAVDLRW